MSQRSPLSSRHRDASWRQGRSRSSCSKLSSRSLRQNVETVDLQALGVPLLAA
ncbi:hypothetical protein [Halomicronema sp. CCY15110]|uniref:hypothetical protein n=1 Tax=Halomicronema sp. CCY15110 TaxID=2767773 RepID=UPI0019526451|nr:hypothetical protein [Halomicronema sp. CCY15110]